jgi:uncharacterized repeat protein (TIGR03806 family)
MRRAALVALMLGACSEAPAPDAGGGPDRVSIDASLPDAPSADATPADVAAPDGGEPPDAGPLPWPSVRYDLGDPRPPALLSAIGLVRVREGVLEHHPDALPYQLNTALFSDFADKSRSLWLPPGAAMTYAPLEVFDLPIGTIISKTFSFAGVPIETRLLVRYADAWRAFPFVWRSDLSDAEYRPRGGVVTIELIDPLGAPRTANYLIPQRNQCASCHERIDVTTGTVAITPIGPKAHHLHRDAQLESWAAAGKLSGLPAPGSIPRAFDFQTLASTAAPAMLDDLTLNAAARDYLDINCAHCHDPRAVQGVTSQLFLNRESTDQLRLGICKEPGSAGAGTGGLRYDLVPGSPGESILLYRMETEVAGEMMPLLGRSLRDDVGVALVREWIRRMPSMRCD